LLDAFYGGSTITSPIFFINLIKNLCWLAVMLIGLSPLFKIRVLAPSETRHPIP
jgi:hypothetical protein